MANSKNPLDTASVGDSQLRGQPQSADTDIRLDDEKDSLYEDGLNVEDDSEHLAGTRAADHRS